MRRAIGAASSRRALVLACGLTCSFALACDGAVVGAPGGEEGAGETAREPGGGTGGEPGGPATPAADDLSAFDAEATRIYMTQLAPLLVRRGLDASEVETIEAGGGDAIRPLLEGWTTEPGFAEAARQMISLKLGASGRTDAIDLDLPGNLAAHLVREGLPFADIVRAPYCVDATGATMECDTGAPYAAGVLATRAFLTGNEGRFNLKRARTMMRTFACLDYPMADDVQPRLAREMLLPMFQARTPDEQEDTRALAGFGNGFACYDCHGQFGAHAQLFVRFDRDGLYHPDATGLQDPDGELGRSVDGLLTSHMLDPARAADESSQMFGAEVANLAEAAQVMTADPAFLGCSTRTLLGFGFGLADSVANAVPSAIVERIVARSVAIEPEPTLATLAIETFSDAAIVSAALDADGESP